MPFAFFGLTSEQVNEFLTAMSGLDTANTLLANAQTLRERVFAQLCSKSMPDVSDQIRIYIKMSLGLPTTDYLIKPKHITPRSWLAATRRHAPARKALSQIPFRESAKTYRGEEQLTSCLQDLADIIAQEASRAFTDEYYPGITDMEWISDEHIDAVLYAMQQEATRERRKKQEVLYHTLHPDRKRALVERRRLWFGRFGITPKTVAMWSFFIVESYKHAFGRPCTRGF